MVEYIVRHWDSADGVGIRLRRSFEIIQLECRLEGNFLQQKFTDFESLTSNSWFTLLWNYVNYYNMVLEWDNVNIPPPRERDNVFMEVILQVTPQEEWVWINRV